MFQVKLFGLISFFLNNRELWVVLKKRKKIMVPFYGLGLIASRLKPLKGGSLLFTTKFQEICGTHFIDLRRMKS